MLRRILLTLFTFAIVTGGISTLASAARITRSDPRDDVRFLEWNGNFAQYSRWVNIDLRELTVNYKRDRRLVADLNFSGSYADWNLMTVEVDVDQDGNTDFFLTAGGDGEPILQEGSPTSDNPLYLCPARLRNHNFGAKISVRSACLGRPTAIRVRAELARRSTEGVDFDGTAWSRLVVG